MKQKYFSLRLYWEGLRQLRLMGLLFTAAVSLIVIFIPVGEYLTTSYPTFENAVQTVTYDKMNPLMIGAFCIVAPFLTLNLFSFVNKREASDFYHAIPATRTCLFFSFFAAVVTWLFIFNFGTALLSTLCHSLFPSLFAINVYSVLQMSLNCFVGGLLVAACVAIAMSVTGTFIMNVLLALLIIFLPRILIKLVLTSVCEAFPLVDGLVFAPLFNTQYNIPAGYILQYFFSGDSNGILTSWGSFLYTLLLALVYLAIAWRLFTGRPSESAGHSAPSPKLQALYRFLVGFTISSIITMSLYNDYNQYYDASDLISWLFAYILTVFAMVVFEILCTRRFKGLIRRSLVTVALLVVANAALVGGVIGTEHLLKSFSPDAAEIDSVRVVEFDAYFDSGYGDEDYFSAKSAKIDLNDPAILKLVSTQLHTTLDLLEASEDRYYEEIYANSSVVVSIKSNGMARLRRIILYEEDLQLLAEKLSENKTYQDLYMNLPADFNLIRANRLFLTDIDSNAKLLFNTLQAEVNEMGFAEWYALLNGGSYDEQYAEKYGHDNSVIANLNFLIANGSGWSEIAVPLYPQVLPKTTALYLKLCNEMGSTDRAKALSFLANDPASCEYGEMFLYNGVVDEDGNTILWLDSEEIANNLETVSAFAASLQTVMNEPIDATKPFCLLTVSIKEHVVEENGLDHYSYHAYEGYFAVPEGTVFPSSAK